MAIDSISKHFKVVSSNDPAVSEPISTNYQLYTLPNNTMIKHHAGNRYVKVNKNIFDKVENSSLSRYDLPYELALGDKHLYMTLTSDYFTPRQSYSASRINQNKISGDMDDTGSYYCISCVTFEDKYTTYGVAYGFGCGCGCGYSGNTPIATNPNSVIEKKYLTLFVRYA